MAALTQQSAPSQAPPVQAEANTQGSSGNVRQNQLGNAELQARLTAGRGSDTGASGAEGGSGSSGDMGWKPSVKAKLEKLAPEAVDELNTAWDAYAAHVRSNVAAGWKQGWMGDLSLLATKRTEVKLDWQKIAGPIQYPYPQVNTREPKEGDPMGICWDWAKDVKKFLAGLGLKHWTAYELDRDNPAHHAAMLISADGSTRVVFDGWDNWQDRAQAQLQSEWGG